MKSKSRKAFLVGLAIMMAFGIQSTPVFNIIGGANQVYAKAVLPVVTVLVSDSATQGDKNVGVTVEVKNPETTSFTYDSATLEVSPSTGITITGGTTGKVTLEKDQSATISFKLSIDRYADTGTRQLRLILKDGGTVQYNNGALSDLTIYEKLATPENGTGNYVVGLEMTHVTSPAEGFSENSDNQLTVKLANNGNTIIKNAELSLTLPAGLSVNNSSNSSNLGYISTGSKKEVSFPITVESNAESKSYAVTAELTGLDYTNKAVSVKKTFYIPVSGTGGSSSLKNVGITNINTPTQVLTQEDFKLSFDVQNYNNAAVKNLKINVEVPEGLLNKTRNTFIESSIPAGSSKNYSVTLFADSGAKAKAYPVKITVEPASSTAASGNVVMQYASVYVKGSGNTKTPQLMVDRYNYGGTFVQAGDQFLLNLGLYNTSKSYTMTNIKVTLTSEDGSFVPVNSSNSFFIEDLKPKGHITESVMLATKPNAEQKTTSLTVDMAYEDGSGNAFTSKDVISIPITQEIRLTVDDIIAPPELYAMMQTGVSVQFYNMGKTVLNNLRVNVQGDFDEPQSNSYYVGNMEGGKSDSYEFTFIPRKEGTMEGKVIFTYEDASGEEQTLEKPFAFQIMGEMPVPDDGMPPEDKANQGGKKWPWIAGGIALVNVVGGVVLWRKRRKKKLNQEMEIDE